MMLALTRAVSPTIGACELTCLDREPIDLDRARTEHADYERTLEALGCTVVRLPDAPDQPDAVFVEDTAVVLDEVAVVTRPGAPSRRAETPSVAAALMPYRTVVTIASPGTLDGGDVLVAGRHVFVGQSRRTNDAGIDQLRRILGRFDYEVAPIPVAGCLHLKSAVTAIGPATLLANKAWVDTAAFAAFDVIEVVPAEPHAANVLAIGSRLVCPAASSRTRARLEARGFGVVPVNLGELAKAEGAVTCCSLVFSVSATGG